MWKGTTPTTPKEIDIIMIVTYVIVQCDTDHPLVTFDCVCVQTGTTASAMACVSKQCEPYKCHFCSLECYVEHRGEPAVDESGVTVWDCEDMNNNSSSSGPTCIRAKKGQYT